MPPPRWRLPAPSPMAGPPGRCPPHRPPSPGRCPSPLWTLDPSQLTSNNPPPRPMPPHRGAVCQPPRPMVSEPTGQVPQSAENAPSAGSKAPSPMAGAPQPPTAGSSMASEPTGRQTWPLRCGREARHPAPPSKRPALPDRLMGRCKTNKSSQGRADAQRLVATRLLDRLHDPLGHFSRLQRIYPRAR